jgi:hypothetical protein
VPSPTGLSKDLPKTHSHHGPRAAHSHNNQTAASVAAIKPPNPSPVPVVIPRPKLTVNSKAVLDAVAGRPRHHLGDVIYNPILKPSRLISNVPSNRGFSSTPTPLPWAMINGKENCTLTMKVARTHLTPIAREEITSRRALWGTDIYSDDSDVIAACIHQGWIRGEWADDVEVDLLDLDGGLSNGLDKDTSSAARKRERENLERAKMEAHAAIELTKPPISGPVHVPPDRDMHVTLLILPRLEKYASTTRFGLQSREFGGVYNGRKSVHDGISFMIMELRWVENGAGAQSRLRGRARRERIRKAMGEVDVASGIGMNGVDFEEKRADVQRIRQEIFGHKSNGEFVSSDAKDGGRGEAIRRTPSEGDKENRPFETTDGRNGGSTTGGVGIRSEGRRSESGSGNEIVEGILRRVQEIAADQPMGSEGS